MTAATPPVSRELLRKYDRPGPRYTSYPTAVEFQESFTAADYLVRLAQANAAAGEPLSFYVHIPFCEERCSFCGCHVIITRQRERAVEYLDHLDAEIDLIAAALPDRRRLLQVHWGGGTPTYLDVDQMRGLMGRLRRHFVIDSDAEVAVEVDPRVTSHEQVDVLRELGFNRLSMGVQDFTPEVQAAINRNQDEAATRELFDYCRAAGFTSINLDLIYGLPLQTPATFRRNLDAIIAMRPERVACYSYAHVPWVRGHQKGIPIESLPPAELKLDLFADAVGRFLAAGYRQIGMDHFALPEDELALAAEQGALHRNFMGYTTRIASDMVGAGVSAISDVRGAFAQNEKKLSTYYAELRAGRFPILRGFELSLDDRIRRDVITRIMCNFRLEKREIEERFGIRFDDYFARERAELAEGPAREGFLEESSRELRLLPLGQLFVRNVCMVFDRYLREKPGASPVFSRTV
jgi:oxygen-independent coproporphyrinogen-3 oxidase